jgi:vacuolar-type H+-ATPase subunit F/Vma7
MANEDLEDVDVRKRRAYGEGLNDGASSYGVVLVVGHAVEAVEERLLLSTRRRRAFILVCPTQSQEEEDEQRVNGRRRAESGTRKRHQVLDVAREHGLGGCRGKAEAC